LKIKQSFFIHFAKSTTSFTTKTTFTKVPPLMKVSCLTDMMESISRAAKTSTSWTYFQGWRLVKIPQASDNQTL